MIPIVQRNDFSVTFVDADDNPLRTLCQLEPFVLAVDLGTELLQAETLAHRTNTLIIWLADDRDSHVMASIRAYMEAGNESFKVLVKVANGQALKDLFVFQHAKLHALQHSIFTREAQDERIEVYDHRGANKLHTGVLKPPIARESSAKLLQVAFASFEHHIIGKTQ